MFLNLVIRDALSGDAFVLMCSGTDSSVCTSASRILLFPWTYVPSPGKRCHTVTNSLSSAFVDDCCSLPLFLSYKCGYQIKQVMGHAWKNEYISVKQLQERRRVVFTGGQNNKRTMILHQA